MEIILHGVTPATLSPANSSASLKLGVSNEQLAKAIVAEKEARIEADNLKANKEYVDSELSKKANLEALLSKLDFKEGKEIETSTYLDDEPTLYKITSNGMISIGSTEFNPYYLIVMKCVYSTGSDNPVKTHVQYKIASSGIYRRYYISGTLSSWTGWEELSPGTDTTPTEGSKKFITSGGVYEAIQELEANKADKSEIPTKVSQLANDAGYLISIPDEYVTDAELESKGYLTQHQDISGKADKPNITNSTETTVSTELADNTELIYAEVTSISVTFPVSVALDYTSSIIFTTPATLPENYSIFPSDVYFKGDECDGGIFIPNAATRYTMLFYYDGTKIIGLVSGIEVTA